MQKVRDTKNISIKKVLLHLEQTKLVKNKIDYHSIHIFT